MNERFIFIDEPIAQRRYLILAGVCIAAIAAFFLISIYSLTTAHLVAVERAALDRAKSMIAGKIFSEPACDASSLEPFEQIEVRFLRTDGPDIGILCERYRRVPGATLAPSRLSAPASRS